MQASLHRERAGAAAGALGLRILDAEAAAIQVVVEIDGHAVEVHQAAFVDDDRHAVELESLIQLRIDLRIEIELMLEAGAPADDHPHAQVKLLGHIAAARLPLVVDDSLDFACRFFGYRDSHESPLPSTSELVQRRALPTYPILSYHSRAAPDRSARPTITIDSGGPLGNSDSHGRRAQCFSDRLGRRQPARSHTLG